MLHQTRDISKIVNLGYDGNVDCRRLNRLGVYVFSDGERRTYRGDETSFSGLSELGLCLLSLYHILMNNSSDNNSDSGRR